MTNVPQFRFTWSASEQSTFRCSYVGIHTWSGCTSPLTGGAVDGTYTLRVEATDLAGNVDPTPASYTWTVDTQAPGTTALGPSGTVTATAARIVFSATEQGATFECRVDGGAWAACGSPLELGGLRAGAHRVDVRARDAAGNADPTPARWEWSVSSSCTFLTTAAGCAPTIARTRIVRRRGVRLTAETGPELERVVARLVSGATIRTRGLARGRRIGSLSLAGADGVLAAGGALVMRRRATLFTDGALRATLNGRRLAISGLPAGVTRVKVTLNGLVVPRRNCARIRWRLALDDRHGGSQTLPVAARC